MTDQYRPYAAGSQPSLDTPEYRSTAKRHPLRPRHPMPNTITETSGPRFSQRLFPATTDLTTSTNGKQALGERIVVAGRITDEDGRAVPHTMIEVWQAGASGRGASRGVRGGTAGSEGRAAFRIALGGRSGCRGHGRHRKR